MAAANKTPDQVTETGQRPIPKGIPVTVFPIASLRPAPVAESAWDYEEQVLDAPGKPTPFAYKLSLTAKPGGGSHDAESSPLAEDASGETPAEDREKEKEQREDAEPPNRWLLRSRVLAAGQLAIPTAYDPSRHVLLASELEIAAFGLAPELAEFAADSWRKLCYHLINAQELQYAHPALCEIARVISLGGTATGRVATLPFVLDAGWLTRYLPDFPELNPRLPDAAKVYAPYFGFVAPDKKKAKEGEDGNDEDAPAPFVKELEWFNSAPIKAAFVPSQENITKWLDAVHWARGTSNAESMKAWQALAAVNTIRPRAVLERLEGYFSDAIEASMALSRLLAVVHMACKSDAVVRCADIAELPRVAPNAAFGASNAPFEAGAARAVPEALADAAWRAKTSQAFDTAKMRRQEMALAFFRRAARAAVKADFAAVLLGGSVSAATKADPTSLWAKAKDVLEGVWKTRVAAQDPRESLGKLELFNVMGIMANSDVAAVRRLHAELACAQMQKAYCLGQTSVFSLASVLPDAIAARMLQDTSHTIARAVHAATATLARVDDKSGTLSPVELDQLLAYATATQRALDTVGDIALIKGATAARHAIDVACISLRRGELEAHRQRLEQLQCQPQQQPVDRALEEDYVALHAGSVGALFRPELTEIVPRKIVLADEKDKRTALEQLASAVTLQWHATAEKSLLGWFKWVEDTLRQKAPIGTTGKTIAVGAALKSVLDVPALIEELRRRHDAAAKK